MNYHKAFRDPELAKTLIKKIKEISTKSVTIMEVCGTHTVSIFRYGLRDVLPPTIRLLSGPGCPVCVTSNENVDQAIALSRMPHVILTTFGDMLKVPGSTSSLAKEKAVGGDIRIVYSTMDALKLAEENPDKEVVFFGIGFETTAPTVAAAIMAAEERGIKNFSIIGSHKLTPQALRALITDAEVKVDAFICPGHVSSIIGVKPYSFLAEEFHVPAVITGFEPVDVLQGIYMLIKQLENGEAKIEVQYARVVPENGNPTAVALLEKVFEVNDAVWRGLGKIPGTGLSLRPEFKHYDALSKIQVQIEPTKYPKGCICGEILRGIKLPTACKLFGKVCTPEEPVGACMVSVEGTCAAFYKYGGR